jgi:hypothetical protein
VYACQLTKSNIIVTSMIHIGSISTRVGKRQARHWYLNGKEDQFNVGNTTAGRQYYVSHNWFNRNLYRNLALCVCVCGGGGGVKT